MKPASKAMHAAISDELNEALKCELDAADSALAHGQIGTLFKFASKLMSINMVNGISLCDYAIRMVDRWVHQ